MSETDDQAKWIAAQWHGKMLVDRGGDKIGKLEDVYVDVETDEPQFGTVKEGFIGRHLTFVPLAGIFVGPDNLKGNGDQGACPRRPGHRDARRGTLPRRRIGAVPPLRDELHATQDPERAPARPTVTWLGAPQPSWLRFATPDPVLAHPLHPGCTVGGTRQEPRRAGPA